MSPLLRVDTDRVGSDITVVSFAGKIVMGPESLEIETLVDKLIQRDEKKVIFDLTRVFYVDSTGMGVIAHCFAKVMRAGGGFRIAGAADRVRDLFKTTRLDTVVAFYPSVLAACQDFTVGQEPGKQSVW